MSQFATTRWSLILDARGAPEDARPALEEICRAYRGPVLSYVRRAGHAGADAEDLTQEFFARLLERRWDERADPARGRFRSFLLTALKRFLIDQHAARTAQKRGGALSHDDDGLETIAGPEALSPEAAFERAWAATVIERAAAADWAPVQVAHRLHDRASYRYFWQVLERAHRTGRALPAPVRHLLAPH